MINSASNV
jgi:small GTP-binding protein